MATRNSTSEEICIIYVATVNALSGSKCMRVHNGSRNDEGGSISRNPPRYGVCANAPPLVAIIVTVTTDDNVDNRQKQRQGDDDKMTLSN